MPRFRGSDQALDHEIEAVDRVIQVRLRRYAREMAELERDRRELLGERAKRRAPADVSVPSDPVTEAANASE